MAAAECFFGSGTSFKRRLMRRPCVSMEQEGFENADVSVHLERRMRPAGHIQGLPKSRRRGASP